MRKRVPKTSGLTWVEHSLTAFNGSGYADRTDSRKYLDSYIDYNSWKKRTEAVRLAKEFYVPLLSLAEHLIETSHPTKQPSVKGWSKFEKYKKRGAIQLPLY